MRECALVFHMCARVQLTCVAAGSPGRALCLWLALRLRAVALGSALAQGEGQWLMGARGGDSHGSLSWAPSWPFLAGPAPHLRQNHVVVPFATSPAFLRVRIVQ